MSKRRRKNFTNYAKKKQKGLNPMLKRIVVNQAKLALESVWLADGKCMMKPVHSGIYDRHYPVPAGQDPKMWQLLVADEVGRMIAEDPLEWTVWYTAFEADDKEEWARPEIKSFPPNTAEGLGDDVQSLLEKLVARKNDKYLMSYGWFATPKPNADLGAIEEQIIHKFRGWGAFNKELCNMVNIDRAIAERKRDGETVEWKTA